MKILKIQPKLQLISSIIEFTSQFMIDGSEFNIPNSQTKEYIYIYIYIRTLKIRTKFYISHDITKNFHITNYKVGDLERMHENRAIS